MAARWWRSGCLRGEVEGGGVEFSERDFGVETDERDYAFDAGVLAEQPTAVVLFGVVLDEAAVLVDEQVLAPARNLCRALRVKVGLCRGSALRFVT